MRGAIEGWRLIAIVCFAVIVAGLVGLIVYSSFKTPDKVSSGNTITNFPSRTSGTTKTEDSPISSQSKPTTLKQLKADFRYLIDHPEVVSGAEVKKYDKKVVIEFQKDKEMRNIDLGEVLNILEKAPSSIKVPEQDKQNLHNLIEHPERVKVIDKKKTARIMYKDEKLFIEVRDTTEKDWAKSKIIHLNPIPGILDKLLKELSDKNRQKINIQRAIQEIKVTQEMIKAAQGEIKEDIEHIHPASLSAIITTAILLFLFILVIQICLYHTIKAHNKAVNSEVKVDILRLKNSVEKIETVSKREITLSPEVNKLAQSFINHLEKPTINLVLEPEVKNLLRSISAKTDTLKTEPIPQEPEVPPKTPGEISEQAKKELETFLPDMEKISAAFEKRGKKDPIKECFNNFIEKVNETREAVDSKNWEDALAEEDAIKDNLKHTVNKLYSLPKEKKKRETLLNILWTILKEGNVGPIETIKEGDRYNKTEHGKRVEPCPLKDGSYIVAIEKPALRYGKSLLQKAEVKWAETNSLGT